MQDLVGIVRQEEEMLQAVDDIADLWKRAEAVKVEGNREFNPGWHTAMDLSNLLTVSEAIARAAVERKESRGAQFREDYPEKSDHFGTVNIIITKGPDGEMQVRQDKLKDLPDELKAIIEQQKT